MEPETAVTPAVTAPPTAVGQPPAAPPAGATALWRRQSQATLDTTLTGSGLPVAAQNRVRAQFAGQVILDVDTLDAVIADERAYLAQINPPAPTNAGAHEERDRVIRVGGSTLRTGPTTDPLDRIRLGLVRWFGGQLPPGSDPSSVPHLDISQFYADMTGDATLQGVWNLDEARRRTGLALSLTDTTMAQVVADAMNVVILDQWDVVAAAGYEWWKPIVHEEDFDSLYDVKWTTVGGFGNLTKNTPGVALNEIAVTDIDTAETTGDWTFAGDLLSVPISTFDKGSQRGVFRSMPKKLAVAAIRTISSDIASIFTANAGVGPTLADSKALFHTDHANLATTAFSVAAWEAVVQAQWKQTEQDSAKALAVRPSYLLVPIELESLGLRVLSGPDRQGTGDNDINPPGYKLPASAVIPVPDFADSNNWATITDPRVYPAIGVGYRWGRKPMVMAEPGGMNSYGMFTANTLRWKVQWVYHVSLITHRGLQKRNVT